MCPTKTENTTMNIFNHILYECLMYRGTLKLYFSLLNGSTADNYLQYQSELTSDMILQISLESHLVHARNLLKFFDDNGCGSHFDDPNYHLILKEFRSNYKLITGTVENKLYEKICSVLHHLSPKRMSTPKPDREDVCIIAARLFPCIHNFWESVQKQDNFVTTFEWIDTVENKKKVSNVLSLFQADNCPPKEWMEASSDCILPTSRFPNDLHDIPIKNRNEDQEKNELPRQYPIPYIESFTTTCETAYKISVLNLDEIKEK